MRALIYGGRGFNNPEVIFPALDAALFRFGITEICHGDGPGPRRGQLSCDKVAGEWGNARGLKVEKFPADWSLGRRAGPIRNSVMLKSYEPHIGLGFPGGSGSADMMAKLLRAKKEVWIWVPVMGKWVEVN